MNFQEILNYKNIAIQASKNSSEILLKRFSEVSTINKWEKSQNALVTEADIESDDAIISILSKTNNNILSEESLHKEKNSDLTWLIDPLCGTVPFSLGMSHWGTNIALHGKNELLMGLVTLPLSNEYIFAAKGFGVELNGNILNSFSPYKKLSRATIALEIDGGDAWKKLIKSELQWISSVGQVNSFSSVSYPIAQLCLGRLGGAVFYGIESVHIAAGAIISEESGMKVSDEKNNPIDWNNNLEKHIVIIAWPNIHEQLLDKIAN